MTLRPLFLLFFITALFDGYSQINELKTEIKKTFNSHLDSLGIKKAVEIDCLSEAAQFHARHLERNQIISHGQSPQEKGDTIINYFHARTYFFCDTTYEGKGEIASNTYFYKMDTPKKKIAQDILNGFLGSPEHKKILEYGYDFIGIGVAAEKDTVYFKGELSYYTVIVYGSKVELGCKRYPAHFGINKYAEEKYRKRYDGMIVIRFN